MAGNQCWIPRLWDGSQQMAVDSSRKPSLSKLVSRQVKSQRTTPALDSLMIEAGGVLFDDSYWQRWLLQLLSYMGMQTQFDAFYRVWEVEYLQEVWRGRWDYWDALGHYLRSCGMSNGRCDEVIVAGRTRRERLESRRRAFPGATATMARLGANGLRIFAVFNSALPTSRIQAKLDAMGLGACFEKIYSSLDIGKTIADEGFVEAIAADSGLRRSSTALFSSRPDSLLGAARQGIYTFGLEGRRAITADCQLDNFRQLTNLVNPRQLDRLVA